MTDATVRGQTREFLTTNFLYMRPDYVLGDDEDLLERGIIDSMGVIELVTFIGDRFGVVVADDDITEENLGTLNAITSYVLGRAAASTVAA